MNESADVKIARLETAFGALAKHTEKVAAMKKRNWLDWLLSAVGIVGVVGVMALVNGKASGDDYHSTVLKVQTIEQIQASHSEAIGTIKTTLERVDKKLDQILLHFAPK